jgi:hypothetical protein
VTGESSHILAIDPGRGKCGLAVVTRTGEVRARKVVEVGELGEAVRALAADPGWDMVVIGRGTGGHAVRRVLGGLGIDVVDVPEAGSTLEARKLYFRYNPPTGWRRLLPAGLRVPPEPVDGYAAEVIARRYLGCLV